MSVPTNAEMSAWLREMRSGVGLMVLGAGIGVGAFLLLDSFRPPERQTLNAMFGGPYYESCREAFQDGRANISRGEPGYRVALDADGDGKACEPYAPR